MSDSKSDERVNELFLELISVRPVDRARYLNRVCKSVDSKIRDQVAELLEADSKADEIEANWIGQVQASALQTILEHKETATRRSRFSVAKKLGRYELLQVAGRGSFATVYLAKDEMLHREVAIKIPHSKCLKSAEDSTAWQAEARMVAKLDHPNIVPVFDIGETNDCPFFIVSKYVAGESLNLFAFRSALSHTRVCDIIAKIARALDYAHNHSVVHRDVKPSNILIDEKEQPLLIDFGLATDERMDSLHRLAGTPSYVSPEQLDQDAVGFDHRTDIFSLGVVLYELLVGQLPFYSPNVAQLLEDVRHCEPKTPRSIDESVPADLERICLKAMAKSPGARYQTAGEFAMDLENVGLKRVETDKPREDTVVVRPKGLQAFDASDCVFYPNLLPGPRVNGLPEPIAYWTSKIGCQDENMSSFKVGAIYGPSGCGKSSLVKAGILPHLDEHVKPLYIDCNHGRSEERIVNRLQRVVPRLDGSWKLARVLREVEHWGAQYSSGDCRRKFLIVLDHFEQWLSAQRSARSELSDALQDMSGHCIQLVVLVRGEYWLNLRRFFKQIDVTLAEEDNCQLVDMFSVAHAKELLKLFGRSVGSLPQEALEGLDEDRVVDALVREISDDGLVVAIRLSMLFELIRNQRWDRHTAKRFRGIKQLGTTFLNSVFADSSAPIRRRQHLSACVDVLHVLSHATPGMLKGAAFSEDRLLEASGYGQLAEFYSLLEILVTETRLVTELNAADDNDLRDDSEDAPQVRRFQLTHDYLVPAIRAWVDEKRGHTLTGRVLRELSQQTEQWSLQRDDRYLPTPMQYLRIQAFTKRRSWSEANRRMMRRANQFYLLRMSVVAAMIGSVCLWALVSVRRNRQTQIDELLGSIERAPEEQWTQFAGPLSQLRHQTAKTIHRLATRSSGELSSRNRWLLELWSGDIVRLCEILREANEVQFSLVVTELARQPDRARQEIRRKLNRIPVPHADEDLRSVTNLVLGTVALEGADVWHFFGAREDPRLQSHLVHGVANRKLLAEILLKRIAVETEASVLFGLLSALGQYDLSQLDWAQCEEYKDLLLRIYATHPDAGVHAASGFVLRKWNFTEDVKRVSCNLVHQQVQTGRDWYYTSSGMCMNIVRVAHDSSDPHATSEHCYAISACEVTRAQLKSLTPDAELTDQLGTSGLLPAAGVTALDALEFCRRLTRFENDQLSRNLEDAVERLDRQSFAIDVLKNGFRLPTPEEWTIACRAGTSTECFFGDKQFTDRYCWRTLDSIILPVGSLLPNRYGLFDTYGNVHEWSTGIPEENSVYSDGRELIGVELNTTIRIMGAGRKTPIEFATLDTGRPSLARAGAGAGYGFRIAQTLPFAGTEENRDENSY